MKIQVLISTMNQSSNTSLQKIMNTNNSIVINQITKKMKIPKNHVDQNSKFLSFKEHGLSRSRNRAMQNADADIYVIADDDMYYVDNYEKIITDAYNIYKAADLIAFQIDYGNSNKKHKNIKKGRINLISSMKLSSVRITFRRDSVLRSSIKFNENFGAGTNNFMGEDNIFLAECLRNGLKIYYVPEKIATLRLSKSSWFQGYDKNYFNIKGKIFYEMSRYFYPLLIIQFAIRKRKLYQNNISLLAALHCMVMGAISLRNSHEG